MDISGSYDLFNKPETATAPIACHFKSVHTLSEFKCEKIFKKKHTLMEKLCLTMLCILPKYIKITENDAWQSLKDNFSN